MRRNAMVLAALWITAPANLILAQDTTGPSPIKHQVPPASYIVPAMEGVTASPADRDEGEWHTVAGQGAASPIVINLGWMPAEPGGQYRARLRFRVRALQNVAGIYLMVREHPQVNTRPITPYHVTSVVARAVMPEQADLWIARELSFAAGGDTHALSGSIIITNLHGEVDLAGFELLDTALEEQRARIQARQEHDQLMQEIRAEAAARQSLTSRPLVFSRSQMKYGLELNYYHTWNDRPLRVNRAYRVPHRYVTSPASYARILEEVVGYDIDGLAFFPETRGRMDMFEMHEQAGIPGPGLLPEFLPAYRENHLDMKTQALELALKSPHAPRIDGKLLITSYAAESFTPAQWAEVLATLRRRVGDSFIFLPTMTNVVALRAPYNAGEPISRARMEAVKAYLRSYLDVCDGIYFNYPPALRNLDRTFDDAFYRDLFIPVFKSVLNEPKYRGKYLGLSAYRAHMSPDRGNSLHEDFTRTLRGSFEAAMDAQPEVIILPEWDEFNENTCFRPTVYSSTSSQRILRYYMSRIRGTDPSPMPDDDVTVPNLILSARKAVTLGEEIIVELLNVPDGTESAPYSAELQLLDERGQIVRVFDPVTFDAAQLQEHRLRIASETIPDVRAVTPVLTIHGYKGAEHVYDEGFHHVQIRATWNWDHLTVKQPLRDLLRPVSVQFTWEDHAEDRDADSSRVIVGAINAPEDLALVEVLGDDDEIYAVDVNDEFFRASEEHERFLIEYRSLNTVELEGSLTVHNASVWWRTHEAVLHQPDASASHSGNRFNFKGVASEHRRWIYVAIPKGDLEAAEFVFDFDKAQFTVTAREVLQRQMIAQGFESGLHITLYPYRRQLDMPYHLNQRQALFRVRVWPEIATEQYHLRATTISGKTYRSRPLLLPRATNEGNLTLRILSEQQRPLDVAVAASRVPVLRYEFAPDRGAVLLTNAGRPFWATLGGFTNTTTGRGAGNGLFQGRYPDNVHRSAPAWVEIDDEPCLQFDGVGTYLELPREALPWRGAFTMIFDIMPTSSADQGILINRVVGSQQGLALSIREGKLHGTFRAGDWKLHSWSTDLPVPPDVWSTITVRYDFEQMTLAVNDRKATFPLSLPASNIGFTIIGEGAGGNWLSGSLRRLRIVHNASP